MKLRNKKTGEIVRVEFLSNWQTDDGTEIGFREYNTNNVYSYNSLTELNDEWEDYEEPKEFYWIDYDGEVKTFVTSYEWQEKMKQIGNYFETREEAEKAAERLRAWKRLKDKGFRFTGVAGIYNNIYVSFETDAKYRDGHVMYDEYSNTDNKLREYNEDLMMLFGGEE